MARQALQLCDSSQQSCTLQSLTWSNPHQPTAVPSKNIAQPYHSADRQLPLTNPQLHEARKDQRTAVAGCWDAAASSYKTPLSCSPELWPKSDSLTSQQLHQAAEEQGIAVGDVGGAVGAVPSFSPGCVGTLHRHRRCQQPRQPCCRAASPLKGASKRHRKAECKLCAASHLQQACSAGSKC